MHTVKLLSGIPAVITNLGGKEQRILTEGKQGPTPDKMNRMLLSFVKKLGDVTLSDLKDDEQLKLVSGLLSCDKQKLFIAARAITYESDPNYIFTYDYTDTAGKKRSKEMQMDLTDGVPEFTAKKFDPSLIAGRSISDLRMNWQSIRDTAEDFDCMTVDEAKQAAVMEFDVPIKDDPVITGGRVSICMMGEAGATYMQTVKRSEISSHTLLMARTLRHYVIGSDIPINSRIADIDKMHQLNLEYIRLVLRIFEGKVETVVEFDKPEDDNSLGEGATVQIDLLQELSFFFLSGQM
ncbi:MAG: hypothetical protein H6550_15905 [Chitinophagales bacterium]|nr:hypothetical protein [Chitinophagales bacterium]